ncbi:MAG: hypothetical protein CMH30_02860 [Micavibrio sp.]|nr:hypothetical protein [Micavibrio sp.]|tara:strand:- start:630 stop:917 length:288 start_codon:yes stop_codon:yes gene_type:complete
MTKEKFVKALLHILTVGGLLAFIALFWRISVLQKDKMAQSETCRRINQAIQHNNALDNNELYDYANTPKQPIKNLSEKLEKCIIQVPKQGDEKPL